MLEGIFYETTKGRWMGAVRQSSLEGLLVRRLEWMTLAEARQLLGISRKESYRLIKLGILKPISGPTVDDRAVWAFERDHVVAVSEFVKGRSNDG